MHLLDFPELQQAYEYDCGASALRSVLEYYGIEFLEGELIRALGTSKKTGTSIERILKVIKKHALKCDSRPMSPSELRDYIAKGIPVILLLQAWSDRKGADYSTDQRDGHYAVAIGYDGSHIVFEDPYANVRTKLTDEELVERWHGQDKKQPIQNHGIAVYGKKSVFKQHRIIKME